MRLSVQNIPVRREILHLYIFDGAANGTRCSYTELGSLFPFQSLFVT